MRKNVELCNKNSGKGESFVGKGSKINDCEWIEGQRVVCG